MEKTKFDSDAISIERNIDLKNEVDRILENGISKKDIVIAKKNIRIAIIAVTEQGKNTAEKKALELENVDVFFQKRGIKELTGELFNKYECIIFVSACGIAVRCISPFL